MQLKEQARQALEDAMGEEQYVTIVQAGRVLRHFGLIKPNKTIVTTVCESLGFKVDGNFVYIPIQIPNRRKVA